jgi:hypothetical protein
MVSFQHHVKPTFLNRIVMYKPKGNFYFIFMHNATSAIIKPPMWLSMHGKQIYFHSKPWIHQVSDYATYMNPSFSTSSLVSQPRSMKILLILAFFSLSLLRVWIAASQIPFTIPFSMNIYTFRRCNLVISTVSNYINHSFISNVVYIPCNFVCMTFNYYLIQRQDW